MMIRAYRMRGHLHANLDPLGIEPPRDREELDPRYLRLRRGRLRPQDLPRHVLGLEYATLREIVAILRAHLLPDARRRVHAHLRSPRRRPGSRSASRGRTRRSRFTREGKRAILNKLIEAEGFEKFCDVKFTGTKRFGLDGGEVADPGAGADHQARRRSSA